MRTSATPRRHNLRPLPSDTVEDSTMEEHLRRSLRFLESEAEAKTAVGDAFSLYRSIFLDSCE